MAKEGKKQEKGLSRGAWQCVSFEQDLAINSAANKMQAKCEQQV